MAPARGRPSRARTPRSPTSSSRSWRRSRPSPAGPPDCGWSATGSRAVGARSCRGSRRRSPACSSGSSSGASWSAAPGATRRPACPRPSRRRTSRARSPPPPRRSTPTGRASRSSNTTCRTRSRCESSRCACGSRRRSGSASTSSTTRRTTCAPRPTDLRLIVNGSTWYATGPAPCPSATCPQRELVVHNRAPFSTASPAPTDLVLPLATFAGDEGVAVLGRGEILGRSAVQVELPFERARSLFPFLTLGGTWRPFFPNDRVLVWLDDRSWFPLRWEVYPAGGHERDAWALRFGLPEEPSRRPIFEVNALSVDLDLPNGSVFDVPATRGGEDQGAVEVAPGDVRHAVGFEPIAPAEVAGLDLYRIVLTPPVEGRRRPGRPRHVRGRPVVPQGRRVPVVVEPDAVRPRRSATGRGDPRWRRGRVLRTVVGRPGTAGLDPRGRHGPVPGVQPPAAGAPRRRRLAPGHRPGTARCCGASARRPRARSGA